MSALSAIDERAADWIAARDRASATGAWTPERQASLDAWLAESTAHRVAWLRLDTAWRQADRLQVLKSTRQRAGPTPALRSPVPRYAPWAAAVGIACAMGLFLAVQTPWRSAPQRYAADLGAREIVALKDGSHVTLNTATQVRAGLTSNQREVWLDRGEAFFEIAHDAAHPFVVHAGPNDITVLGTRFSVRREGDSVRVAVSEGRVQVASGKAPPTILVRDDTALSEPGNVLVTHRTPEQIQANLGWLQGKLVFRELTIGDAVREFNRYNHRRMVVDDPDVSRIEIGGVFDANNVDAFARLLQAGFGLDVQTRGDEIHVGKARQG